MKTYCRSAAAWLCLFLFIASCSKKNDQREEEEPEPEKPDTALVNPAHLNKLAVQVNFENGQTGTGVYIYSNYPSYTPAVADGEGFTCVDDVARALQFYVRADEFDTSAAYQDKAKGMAGFLLNMQSANGYFYNFVQTGNLINKFGATSINMPKWWSWRALHALTEAAPAIATKDATLATRMNEAADKLIAAIKTDLTDKEETTTEVEGLNLPTWLPEGADQAATLIQALIPYNKQHHDAVIDTYIRKLADGIVLMQQGNEGTFPYYAFLSSGNRWHAYGNDQSVALFAAAAYLNDDTYASHALAEVDNFYSKLVANGLISSFQLKKENNALTAYNQSNYEQIAYGIRPMVFAALDAYKRSNDEKYATLAGRLASWFLGNNVANVYMYTQSTGVCFDAIATGNAVNRNSGAESTIEALLTMQRISRYPSAKAALNSYKR